MELIIKQINNKWTVNEKFFNEMTEREKEVLTNFIKNYEESI
jgi:mannitol/fructose-specific phosphotransferase system IIA component